MGKHCKRRAAYRFGLAVMAAVVGLLWTATPARAQYFIAPDGSFVAIQPQATLPLGGNFVVGPVVAAPGNQAVRIGGAFGPMTIFKGTIGPGFASFPRPVDATARAKASYIYGGKNPPYPAVVFPWQPWW